MGRLIVVPTEQLDAVARDLAACRGCRNYVVLRPDVVVLEALGGREVGERCVGVLSGNGWRLQRKEAVVLRCGGAEIV